MKRYLGLLIFLWMISCLNAEITPSGIFGDHMVLQRGQPIPVWGTASPGETVTVSLGSDIQTATADNNGKWMVRLAATEAAENVELTIKGVGEASPIVFKDVAIGEVWLCSGQSNMGFSLNRVKNAKEEIATATNSAIRLFKVDHNAAQDLAPTVKGAWNRCTPQIASSFSAVGYLFGREIQPYVNVPVGLIDSTWGGTPAEAWTRSDILKTDPAYASQIQQREAEFGANGKKKQEAAVAWEKSIDQLLAEPGTPNSEWLDPKAVLNGWKTIHAPGFIEPQIKREFDGVAWMRKVVTLPSAMANREGLLSLGPIDNYDFTFVNGQLVGKVGKEVAQSTTFRRQYKIPTRLLKEGENVILIQVIDARGQAGLCGTAKDLSLSVSGQSIELAGEWQCLVEKDLGKAPVLQEPQYIAGSLYDGMIGPLIPYGIRGVVWYQGESNADRSKQYRKLFPEMIRNWRTDWGQGDFPFYFVQLANFQTDPPEPSDSNWAEVREGQLKTLSLPNTGMAVIIDIGDATNIHPANKQDVAKRLSLWALAKTYGITKDGQPLVYSGPLYREMKIEGTAIRISFDSIGGGLIDKGGEPLKGFAIAGKDRKFVWAEAKIDGDTVVVSSPSVPAPTAVRYDWANNPNGNLYNAEGLPASPFRTDNQ